jgi:adenosylhomocysteine nucleosidase
MGRCAAQSSGSGPTAMPKVAIVAALEREVSGLTRSWNRLERHYDGRRFVFLERDDVVVVCGGIGLDSARRAAEAAIALYHPTQLHSVGFAGALNAELRVGDLIAASVVIDARDGSRAFVAGADSQNSLVTYMSVAGVQQKRNLAHAFGAKAVDMEAAAVAAAAGAHGIPFAATKVISDESNFEIPEMDRFIDAHGHFRTVNFAVFIALRPWLWRRVAMLAGNSRKAARVLGEHLERWVQDLSLRSEPVAAASGSHAGGSK